jgi:hypothetical protein
VWQFEDFGALKKPYINVIKIIIDDFSAVVRDVPLICLISVVDLSPSAE